MYFKFNDGGRTNTPFKKKTRTADCVFRSIAIATNQEYLKVWNDLFFLGRKIGHLPNSRNTFEPYIFDFGFKPRKPIRIFNKKVRLKNWGHKLALVHTIRHLTCVKDYTVFDTWDCRPWCMNKWYSIEE